MLYDIDMYGDKTYTEGEDELRNEIENSSWCCCLFTVLALGCEGAGGEGERSPGELFGQAKALSRFVVEDESIQSIQALLLMVRHPSPQSSITWTFVNVCYVD